MHLSPLPFVKPDISPPRVEGVGGLALCLEKLSLGRTRFYKLVSSVFNTLYRGVFEI